MSEEQDCFQWSEEESHLILQANGTNQETLKQDVESIKKWIETQLHFPEMPTDAAIAKFLLFNKLSVERVKQKLDAYYSIRNAVPELFNKHPLSDEMVEATNQMYAVGIPKLTPDLDRITLYGFLGSGVADAKLLFANIINLSELRLIIDKFVAEIVIFDLTNVNLSILTTITPSLLAKFIAIVEKVFSARLKAIHIIHGLPKLEPLLNMTKSLLSQKHRSRYHVHKDYESLHKMVDKSILPKELGGQNITIREIAELQKKKFIEYKWRFDQLVTLRSKEELRSSPPINDEILGYHGNFKQLAVD